MAASLLLVLAPARPDATVLPKCFGQVATDSGTNHADRIVGTNGRDVIVAYGGVDQIDGRGGNDMICAGPGADTVKGGPGNDDIWGDGGGGTASRNDDDRLLGGPGMDFVVGGDGADDLIESARDSAPNDLRSGPGDDTVAGGAARDEIVAGAGEDVIRANGGNDKIVAGPGGGDDTIIHGDAGNDRLTGGDGNDSLAGGPGPDFIQGGQGADTIAGGDGDDGLSGGGSDDSILGLAGADEIYGGAGKDVCSGGAGRDSCDGGAPSPDDPAQDPDVCEAEQKVDCGEEGSWPRTWDLTINGHEESEDGTFSNVWSVEVTVEKLSSFGSIGSPGGHAEYGAEDAGSGHFEYRRTWTVPGIQTCTQTASGGGGGADARVSLDNQTPGDYSYGFNVSYESDPTTFHTECDPPPGGDATGTGSGGLNSDDIEPNGFSWDGGNGAISGSYSQGPSHWEWQLTPG